MDSLFLSKVEKYIEKNGLLNEQDNVVLGVSGGADSVALLLVLDSLKNKYKLKLNVLHVNHGIREEAKDEAEYVETLCNERNIPFTLVEIDIIALSKEKSMGTEEAGRFYRYKAFREKINELGGGMIAVAHNKNDRAETMLFNLARGTGPIGLASIAAKKGDIIRPLLCVERSEIEAFLKSEGVDFCIDKSNYSDEYSRNRIRNRILPQIKSDLSEKAVEHMANTADQLSELNAFADRICKDTFQSICEVKEGNVLFDKAKLLSLDIYLQKLLIKRAFDTLVPHNKDITHVHIEDVLDICRKNGQKKADLPYQIRAVSSYNELCMFIVKEESVEPYERILSFDKEGVSIPGYKVVSEVLESAKGLDLRENLYTKYFDYDKMNKCPVLRTRQSRDEITVNSKGGKKKLKDYMIDIKIPRDVRDTIPVLAIEEDILWVIGYRISEAYKVSVDTKRVLKISVNKEA